MLKTNFRPRSSISSTKVNTKMASMQMPYRQRISREKGDMVKVTKETAIREKINMGTITKGKVLNMETKPNTEIKVTRSHIPNKEEITINPGISIEEDFRHEETD